MLLPLYSGYGKVDFVIIVSQIGPECYPVPASWDPYLDESARGSPPGRREVCSRFPNEYWRGLDAERRYPEEFVAAMTGPAISVP